MGIERSLATLHGTNDDTLSLEIGSAVFERPVGVGPSDTGLHKLKMFAFIMYRVSGSQCSESEDHDFGEHHFGVYSKRCQLDVGELSW